MSKNKESRIIARFMEGLAFCAGIMVFAGIVYALTTWSPGGDPEADPGDGNVDLSLADWLTWSTDGGNTYLTSGNVGIGTSSPNATLSVGNNVVEIRGTGNIDSELDILLDGRGGIGSESHMYFQIDTDNNTNDARFVFSKNSDSSSAEPLMIIQEDGRISIGPVAAPSADLTLDVEGKIGGTYFCDKNGNNCTAASDLGGVSSPACTLCESCGGSWTSYQGKFGVDDDWSTNVHIMRGSSCSGSLTQRGNYNSTISLCCK